MKEIEEIIDEHIEYLLEEHQYRTKVILKGFEGNKDILDGLLYEFKLTVREIEKIKEKYSL